MDITEVTTKMNELAGDNSELKTLVSLIETDFQKEQGKKDTLLEEVKTLKTFKSHVRQSVGAEEGTSLTDIGGKFDELISSQKAKIDSLSSGASTKNVQISEDAASIVLLRNEMSELKGFYEQEKTTNLLNGRKDDFRKALSDNNITSARQQDMAIQANISQLMGIEDVGSFVKTYATENPYLKESSLTGGSGSIPKPNHTNTKKTLGECKTKEERSAYFQQQIDAKS